MVLVLYFSDSGISYEDWLSILRENSVDSYLNLTYKTEIGSGSPSVSSN